MDVHVLINQHQYLFTYKNLEKKHFDREVFEELQNFNRKLDFTEKKVRLDTSVQFSFSKTKNS